MLKYYITVLFLQYTETLDQFFCLFIYLGQMKIWKLAYLFDLSNQRIKTVLRYFTGCFSKWTLSQKWKKSCSVKTTICSHTMFT